MCPKELSMYLKERTLEDMEEIVLLAEKLMEAHGKTLSSGAKSNQRIRTLDQATVAGVYHR